MLHFYCFFVICLLPFASTLSEPFQVIWNAPSWNCFKKFGITIPLKEFGIKANLEQAFLGDKIALFYSTALGIYPSISDNQEIVNGGIPQAVNIANHLAKMRADINRVIPNKTFDGPAIIDWEDWRPLFEENFSKMRKYQRLSVESVQNRFPNMSTEEVQHLAATEFEDAARNLMTETLRYAKLLRPLAKWGFYGFPYCHCDTNKKCKCNDKSKGENDRVKWLFMSSVALYPSTYLYMHQTKWLQNERHLYVQAILKETLRVRRDIKQPLFAFTKFSYDTYTEKMDMYSAEDLCSTLKQPADLGFSGVLVWSSSQSTNKAAKCQQISDFVQTEFGPTANIVIQLARKCATDVCSNRGVCISDPSDSCGLESTSVISPSCKQI